MPTLEEVKEVSQPAAEATSGVVDATVVESPAEAATPTPEATTTTPAPETTKPTKTSKGKKEPKEKKESKKPAKTEASTEDTGDDDDDKKLVKPPMTQIARDVERLILDKSIGGHKVKKLEYKCGKIIYGLPNPSGSGKDFRVIALKARKKTKTVEGKSRCIFYFGIPDEHSKILKEVPEASTTNFGRCAVQCKRPLQLVIDKTTFDEKFNQDADKVVESIEKLITYTIDQKSTEYDALIEKQKAKAAKAKADEAKAKKKKAEAKAE